MNDSPQNRKQRRHPRVTTDAERAAAIKLALAGRYHRRKLHRRVGKRPQPDDPRQVQAIERGLDLLLRSYLRVRDKPPRCPAWVVQLDDDFHEYTREGGFIVFGGAHSPTLYVEEHELVLDLMGENPVRAALRQGVHLLGEEIYRLTKSNDAMRDVLERVAERDPPHYGDRVEVMDHAWDGIGGWYA